MLKLAAEGLTNRGLAASSVSATAPCRAISPISMPSLASPAGRKPSRRRCNWAGSNYLATSCDLAGPLLCGCANLRTQVMLWTVLPDDLADRCLSGGIGTHQASMRRLAVDENQRLAMIIKAITALNAADGLPEPSVLDALLKLESTTHATQVLLLDDAGQTLLPAARGRRRQ